MKKDIHPISREIVLVDRVANFAIKVVSTAKTTEVFELE
jgi:ribosomal protein L31